MYDKIVVVTRKTRLQELIERFNTKSQAKFYIEHSGGDFADYLLEDDTYLKSLDEILRSLTFGLKVQVVDRMMIPTFLFTEQDLLVTIGQDGLVANCAKYALGCPVVAVNPDPNRFDGILLPFHPKDIRKVVESVLKNTAHYRDVTLALASLNDGQKLLAFNDLFIGIRTHLSARYIIKLNGASEPHSSSGIIVSTGAGATGWLSSVLNMAIGISSFLGGSKGNPISLNWEDRKLIFAVREPFLSKYSKGDIVAGIIEEGKELILESLMPREGVIFSDGIEADYISFNSGGTAKIGVAPEKARLVIRAN